MAARIKEPVGVNLSEAQRETLRQKARDYGYTSTIRGTTDGNLSGLLQAIADGKLSVRPADQECQATLRQIVNEAEAALHQTPREWKRALLAIRDRAALAWKETAR